MKRMAAIFLCAVFAANTAFSQDTIVKVSVEPVKTTMRAGEQSSLNVVCDIDEAFHISDVTSGMFSVTPKPVQGVEFGEPAYPQGEADAVSGTVYRGTIHVRVPFTVLSVPGNGQIRIQVKVGFQPCTEDGMVCYPPDETVSHTDITVVQGAETGSITVQNNRDQELTASNASIAARLGDALQKGSFTAFLIVFLGGLLTSFTPCVYPMIPITIAVIGAQASGGKLKGFVLSLFYVLGIAVTFTSLGVIAAKTGALFGTYAQHPAVLILISAIFLLMGLSMLGAFVVQIPSSVASKLRGKKKSGFVGAFLTGLVAGIVVSPCVSPLLVVILTWVAKTGSVLLGAGLLFTFSLGLGVLFIVIGTFSGAIKALPKSGTWMEYIERGLGLLLIILALVFIKPVLPSPVYTLAWAGLFIVLSVFLGSVTHLGSGASSKEKLSKAAGLILLVAGSTIVFFSIGARMGVSPVKGPAAQAEESAWYSTESEAFKAAGQQGKPVLIDFYAEWCAACKELDEKTWPAPAVAEELARYIPLKLDMTDNGPETKALQEKYSIVGMPTVIILDPDGTERYRFEGFKGPEQVAGILRTYAK